MYFFLLFSLLFTHPLDNGPFNEINFSEINTLICKNHTYISPINGMVDEIITNKNGFSVKISNNFVEIIIVGLDHVYTNVGSEINIGDEIGVDYRITNYSKFMLVQYDNSTLFPQFINNKLSFFTGSSGNTIYSMESGIITETNYDNNGRGNFTEIISMNTQETIFQVQYWHKMSFTVRMGDTIERNSRIGYVGNTGLSTEPNLTVFFSNNLYDLRVVYIKNK